MCQTHSHIISLSVTTACKLSSPIYREVVQRKQAHFWCTVHPRAHEMFLFHQAPKGIPSTQFLRVMKAEIEGCYCSVAPSCLTLRHHGLQHARLPCPSVSPGVCSNSCPLSRWCHPNISSSVASFSSCLSLSQYQATHLKTSERIPLSFIKHKISTIEQEGEMYQEGSKSLMWDRWAACVKDFGLLRENDTFRDNPLLP